MEMLYLCDNCENRLHFIGDLSKWGPEHFSDAESSRFQPGFCGWFIHWDNLWVAWGFVDLFVLQIATLAQDHKMDHSQ